jgi:hypothetical protein
MGFYRCRGEGHLLAGDSAENLEYRGWLNFNLSELPSGIASFESAALSATQLTVYGTPYGPAFENLGNLLVEHTSFSTIDETAHSAPALRELGIFASTRTPERKSANVLDAIADDYTNRAFRKNQSQYRLRFTKATDADWVTDAADFSCGVDGPDPTLSVTYLIP